MEEDEKMLERENKKFSIITNIINCISFFIITIINCLQKMKEQEMTGKDNELPYGFG